MSDLDAAMIPREKCPTGSQTARAINRVAREQFGVLACKLTQI